MVWQRISESDGVLGALRLCEPYLDPRCTHLMVTNFQYVAHVLTKQALIN